MVQIRITVGAVGQANSDIHQRVSVINSEEDKMPWLLHNLQSFVDNGDVLVFGNKKQRVDEVEQGLRQYGFKVTLQTLYP